MSDPRYQAAQTKVTFRLSYQAPGGILGYIADGVAVKALHQLLFAVRCRSPWACTAGNIL
jgi:hypothetical protein